jgi:16S rRNA (guanine1207-N2)-methyltransferase
VNTTAILDSTTAAALDTLFLPFEAASLAWPGDDRVAFLRARACVPLRRFGRKMWSMEQSFRPFADQLERDGFEVTGAHGHYPLVLVVPPRQRDEARALFSRAAALAGKDGVVVAAMANAEGARSGQDDFTRLLGPAQVLVKNKCRVFWATGRGADPSLAVQWRLLDATRPVLDGRFLSRPGLFAWDRVDPASALLLSQLPADIGGVVADLGAGFGFLGCGVLDRYTGVRELHAFEAEGRALEPLRENLAAHAGRAQVHVHWHDVTTGLPGRYDSIVSNPPFHQGRADRPELGQAFIDAAADALSADGQCYVVANRHLPYEATFARRFRQVRVLADRDGFKVLEAKGVRR